MGRRTRECYLCGKKYEYCPTCSQDKMKPSWMAEFHEHNCKSIFEICTKYNMQLMTKEEAKAALEQCDLSKKDSFKDYVQRDIVAIFTDEPKAKRSKQTVNEDVEIKTVESHEVVNKTKE